MYCRSNLVDAARAYDEIDRIAPFRVSKVAAISALRDHLAGSFWAPGEIRAQAKARRSTPAELVGVLVPFYAYTATVRGEYRCSIGVHWYKTETRREGKGKSKERSVRKTQWLPLRGTMAHDFQDHLVAASTGLHARETTALQPFDLGCAVGLDPRLLAGWPAELASVSRSHARSSARERILQIARNHLQRRLLPGDGQRLDYFNADIEICAVELVLLPVWVSSFRFGDRVTRLLVNGQTGRCIGRPPVSKTKVAIAILLGVVVLIIGVLLFGEQTAEPSWRL